jgi:hypothetical protein
MTAERSFYMKLVSSHLMMLPLQDLTIGVERDCRRSRTALLVRKTIIICRLSLIIPLPDLSSHLLALCVQTCFFLLSVGVQVFLSDRARRQYKKCVVVSR